VRIVQIAETLEVGGVERLAVSLALEQRRAGHEPYLYCLMRGGLLADKARAEGIPVRVFDKTPGVSPRLVVRLTRQLREDAADVVHTHNPGVHPYGALAARLAGIAAVVNTRHGVTTSAGATHVERYFRATMCLTGRVVCVSDHSRRVLVGQRRLPARKACVIHNGVTVSEFGGSARCRENGHGARFGTVGRLVPVKGHRILIAAFAMLLRRMPEAHLSIAGDGPLFGEIRNDIDDLGIGARVALKGETRDVPGMLRNFDFFVCSSVSEGLPLTVLEAMAAGLPIVSTRVGGVPEVAPEGQVAWYCDPGNADDLARAMYEAANSADAGERGCAARAIACSRFTISHTQQEYDKLYREVLGSGRPA